MGNGYVLGELARLGPFFAVAAHPPGTPPVPPWRPVSELTGTAGPPDALGGRIAAVRVALADRGGRAVSEIEPRVAASAVHLGLVARLTAPALGAAVLGTPLDLRPDGLWWQDETGGPVPLSVPATESAAGTAAADWAERLVEDVLVPVTAATARAIPVADRVLWGNVASAVNSAAAQLARQRQELAAAAWRAAARLFGSPRLRGEPHPPGPGFRRSSCCLFYRLEPGTASAICGDCVLGGRGRVS
jgi:hypothetical protein